MVGKDYSGSVKGFTGSVSPNLVGLHQIDFSRFSNNIIDIYDLTSAMIKSCGVWGLQIYTKGRYLVTVSHYPILFYHLFCMHLNCI